MLKYRLHQGITTISCLLPPSEIIFYVSTHSGLQEFLPPLCHPTPQNIFNFLKFFFKLFQRFFNFFQKLKKKMYSK